MDDAVAARIDRVANRHGISRDGDESQPYSMDLNLFHVSLKAASWKIPGKRRRVKSFK